MARSLIIKFHQNTSRWPLKLVFYRDGVSEGQFIEVLNSELQAIRRACKSVEGKTGMRTSPPPSSLHKASAF